MDEQRAYLLKEYKIWVTKTGDPIPVDKMSDNHLVCTIRLLKKSAKLQQDMAVAEYIRCSPMIQMMGDAAQDAIESEFDRLLSAEWDELVDPEAIQVLLDEVERRGIDWENNPWY